MTHLVREIHNNITENQDIKTGMNVNVVNNEEEGQHPQRAGIELIFVLFFIYSVIY